MFPSNMVLETSVAASVVYMAEFLTYAIEFSSKRGKRPAQRMVPESESDKRILGRWNRPNNNECMRSGVLWKEKREKENVLKNVELIRRMEDAAIRVNLFTTIRSWLVHHGEAHWQSLGWRCIVETYKPSEWREVGMVAETRAEYEFDLRLVLRYWPTEL
jgi:hypothetical protein